MVSGHPPAQGRLQLVGRGVDAPVGQRGQGLGHVWPAIKASMIFDR